MTNNITISNLNITKGSIPPLVKYKIVFLGDQAVGKSSIINRFMYDIFDGNQHVHYHNQRPTIGIDFISHNINLEEKIVRLQLWDTAGQQRFRTLIPNYIRDCSVAVIVFDISSYSLLLEKSSFTSVQGWIDDVREERGQEVIICLLANKIDKVERAVGNQNISRLVEQNGLFFKEVSAKSGQGVKQFFQQMATMLPGSELTKVPQKIDPTIKPSYLKQQTVHKPQLKGIKIQNNQKPPIVKKKCC